MFRLLFIGVLLITTLFANDINTTDINKTIDDSSLQKVLYISYKETPSRVLKGEIFSVTLKTLSTVQNFIDIYYEFSNYHGLKPLNDTPYREKDSKYYYDTFYFLTTHKKAKLPDFTVNLINYEGIKYKKSTLLGKSLNVIALNPKKNFSNIIADHFELIGYKTTTYDNKNNIIIFIATAQNCDIKSLKLNNVQKQGIESITESHLDSKIIYYAIIDKKIENFSFSYFNLQLNKFLLVNIPIILNDDSVTTQTDLKPKDQSRERLKMAIAAGIALCILIFFLWRKRYIYLVFISIPLAYIAYIAIPSKDVCIKVGSTIHLLPVYNGTIFETTSSKIYLQKEGNVKEFVKVKLKNEKVGWVKNEDICSY